MSYLNKCRICLLDEANLPIFQNVECKESIHFKLFLCFNEKIRDIEGYPRNICEHCNDILKIVADFITKYRSSCELLESIHIAVKNEAFSDNESDGQNADDIIGLGICKEEFDPDTIETFNNILSTPAHMKKPDLNLTKVKAKLKSLKEINFKRKPTRVSQRKSGKIASAILEEKCEWNGKSSNAKKIKKPKEEKPLKQLGLTGSSKPTCPQPPPPSLCDICGEVFKNYSRMMSHKKDKHINKPTKCPKCPQSSRLYSGHYLGQHIARVHGERKFICDTCGSGFGRKGGLNAHIKAVHTKLNKKTFECETCKKCFTNTKSLIIHERSAHTGLRPAECSVCGARFYHEEYLQEHMRLHTGETPYKCPICGRGYAQRGNMKSHIAHNHRLTDLSEEQIKNLKPSWFKHLKKS